MKLSRKATAAIKKHGINNCVKAFKMNEFEGEGLSTISYCFPSENRNCVTIQQCNSMVNAGRELLTEQTV